MAKLSGGALTTSPQGDVEPGDLGRSARWGLWALAIGFRRLPALGRGRAAR
ncbi:MAG: hypothetical protein RSC66_00045 [Comamonas sp.]